MIILAWIWPRRRYGPGVGRHGSPTALHENAARGRRGQRRPTSTTKPGSRGNAGRYVGLLSPPLEHGHTTPEVAQNFREHGNDYFKGKRYREALGFYTQGVDANPTSHAILEALLSNRAACNLELGTYESSSSSSSWISPAAHTHVPVRKLSLRPPRLFSSLDREPTIVQGVLPLCAGSVGVGSCGRGAGLL